MDWQFDMLVLPVSDVDRAKAFYTEKVGFTLNHDHVRGTRRFVRMTPRGSSCSIVIGWGLIDTPPGSVQAMHLVVPDIGAARTELVQRGVEATEVEEFGDGISFFLFKDPDGNGWAVQTRGSVRP
jgi:catechol 2,3-dioxygenase-like lactoylglutathione lyase family enzyme